MCKQDIEIQIQQYAKDELLTIHGIKHPTLIQVEQKALEISSWPIFKNMLAGCLT